MKRIQLANYRATHFGYSAEGKVATITLNRPERKNPLTFDSYGELRDLFRELTYATHARGAKVATDNTWASPLGFQPLTHGCDITVMSLTKIKFYLSPDVPVMQKILGGIVFIAVTVALVYLAKRYAPGSHWLPGPDCWWPPSTPWPGHSACRASKACRPRSTICGSVTCGRRGRSASTSRAPRFVSS